MILGWKVEERDQHNKVRPFGDANGKSEKREKRNKKSLVAHKRDLQGL